MERERERIDEALRELRVARGLSASAAARRAGLSKAAVLGWEGGRRIPSGPHLSRLLDALEADDRLRARLLHAADPAHARIALAHTALGAPVDVGMVLRTMRRRRGLTQADLARRVGVAQGTVAKWENGDANPPAESVHALGFALGASVEETLALAAARGVHDPLGEDVGPEEAPERIYRKMLWEGPLSETMAIAYEAEAWRRAARDPRWDSALCRAISARAFYEYYAGAPGLGEAHARRAIRLARTPESRWAAIVSLDVVTEVAAHRRDDPTQAATLAGEWADTLPEGDEKAWALWIQTLRLAALGKRRESREATRRFLDAMHPSNDAAWRRTNARTEIHLAAGDGRAAADALDMEPREFHHFFLYVRVRHALGEPAPESWMETMRKDPKTPYRDLTWHDRKRWATLERRQARLRKRVALA